MKEIRDDLRNNPTKEEFLTLQKRVEVLEENQHKSGTKMATIAGSISVIMSILSAIAVKLIAN